MVTASKLQFVAALLATVRAAVLLVLPRWTLLPKASNDNFSATSLDGWFLAAILWLDVANDWLNRTINAHLPMPNGAPLAGAARAAAHLGLAVYAAWVCGILAFVGWLVRQQLPRFGIAAAAILWGAFVATDVLLYHRVRGDVALRALGLLHIAAFVCEIACLSAFVRTRGKFGTERVCAIWLVFLGLSAGMGPLRPWDLGTIDRVAAEKTLGQAMTALYASIIATIIWGASWSSSLVCCGSSRWRR